MGKKVIVGLAPKTWASRLEHAKKLFLASFVLLLGKNVEVSFTVSEEHFYHESETRRR